ncbi:MAG TPA: sulfatase-like hydrolase/transferase [Chloroflexota bacterium]|nr:sulfatase-like hydrolase/transferase [Chloroflexota bacterium]
MSEAAGVRRPNVLLLMADQHRADVLGAAQAAGAGDWPVQTPHLDRLCRQGVRFARAYTESPVCVSARATLLTGRLPHRTGVFDNGYRVGAEAVTLPKLLRERGYHCQAIGKMHFWPVREHHGLHRMWLSEEIPASPEEDEFLAELLAAGYGHVEEPHGARHEMYYIPQVSQLPAALHTTAWTGRKTIEYLHERSGAEDRSPFFCWTSFIKPHPPFDPPVPWHTLYRPTDMPLPVRLPDEAARHTYYHRRQNRFKWTDAQPDDNLLRMMRAYYTASVSFIDFWIGQILHTLEQLGLRRDTLVLYVADHGEYLGDHGAYGKRGYHDPACRIPFILSWPGTLPQDETRQQLVGLADVAPTIVAAADGAASAPASLGMDGESVLPAAAEASTPGRAVLIGQLAEKGLGLYLAMDDAWKYIYSAPDDREYLMHRGPGEGRACDERECLDLATSDDAAHRGALVRLREALLERFRRDGYHDPLDETDPAGLRRYPAPSLGWEALDELERRSVVARGWQFARWNRIPPYDGPDYNRRLDPALADYTFPSLDVRPAGPG